MHLTENIIPTKWSFSESYCASALLCWSLAVSVAHREHNRATMTTARGTRSLRRLEVEPAASNPSVLGRAVPVVTPTSAHSQTIINEFLEKVKDILDKGKVSSGKQNDLMEWLKMNNQNSKRGWLQNAAFETIFEHEKGIPGTAEKRMWLFCLFLLISGLFRGEGSPAKELGKAYGIGEETVRRNSIRVFTDMAVEFQQVHSFKEEAKLRLQELQQAFRAYEQWTPKKSKQKGCDETPNPVYTFLVERRNEMGDKFRGCLRHLLLGCKDPPFAPRERLLLFSLRAALTGMDESLAMDLLGEGLDFDNKYLRREFGHEAMSPLLLFSPPESMIAETSAENFLHDLSPALPLVSPASCSDGPDDRSEGDGASITKENNIEAPKLRGESEFTLSSLSSGLEERKAVATIQSFSDATHENTTRDITTFREMCNFPKILASSEGGKSDRVQIWLNLSQQEATVLLDSWAVSHVEMKNEQGIATLRAQGARQKRTVKLAHLENNRSNTEHLERVQRDHRFKRFGKVVTHFVGEGDPKYFLRGYVAKHHPSLSVINKAHIQLTTQEALALRDILRISGNQLGKLDQFFRKLKNLQLFQPSVKRRWPPRRWKLSPAAKLPSS